MIRRQILVTLIWTKKAGQEAASPSNAEVMKKLDQVMAKLDLVLARMGKDAPKAKAAAKPAPKPAAAKPAPKATAARAENNDAGNNEGNDNNDDVGNEAKQALEESNDDKAGASA